MPSSPDATLPPPPSRPVRKDEIELHERGLYIESWLPERRSRRALLLRQKARTAQSVADNLSARPGGSDAGASLPIHDFR